MARSLSILLHAHLPYVRDPEGCHAEAQSWLFRVLSESYVPALRMLLRLAVEDVPFRIGIVWSPVLKAMLADALIQNRYLAWLEREIEAADDACRACEDNPVRHGEAERIRDRLVDCLKAFTHDWDRDVTGQWRALEIAGCVQRLGTAATHAWLPALADQPEMLRAQIRLGSGGRPGFWLPERGCCPEVERALGGNGVRWTVIDGVQGPASPVVLEGGVVGFPASDRLNRAVSARSIEPIHWSEEEGITVCPVDLESIGHWWDEGVPFLERVLRHAAASPSVRLELPGDYLNAHPEHPQGVAALDGRGLVSEEMQPHLARIASLAVAEARENTSDIGSRRLAQLLRELLLAQSSDWALLAGAEDRGIGDYAKARLRTHLARARALLDGDDPELLARSESENPVFSNLDWHTALARV